MVLMEYAEVPNIGPQGRACLCSFRTQVIPETSASRNKRIVLST